ncbi:MAG TPA: hypothetical protein VG796_22995 [Verrucomicrobiales bacterium]|nr:hypothetical protein [Verrucomicrobiales bacterium]
MKTNRHISLSFALLTALAAPSAIGQSPALAPSSKPAKENLPFGIPVVGNPHFVYSPYAPEKGRVDVSGLKPGTRIECPYTNKHFRVPGKASPVASNSAYAPAPVDEALPPQDVPSPPSATPRPGGFASVKEPAVPAANNAPLPPPTPVLPPPPGKPGPARVPAGPGGAFIPAPVDETPPGALPPTPPGSSTPPPPGTPWTREARRGQAYPDTKPGIPADDGSPSSNRYFKRFGYEQSAQGAGNPQGQQMQSSYALQAVNPGEQIVREIKLRVFQRHFEMALSETMEMKKALLDAPPDKRESMEAKLNALRGFADQLEKDIHSLAGHTTAQGMRPYRTQQNQFNPTPKEVAPTPQGPKAPAYSPGKAAGAADAGDSGKDSRNAWCPASSSSRHEWLQLTYGERMEISGVHIYETSASGALSRVVAVNSNDRGLLSEHILWSDREPVNKMPFVRIINAPPGVRANSIRLEFEPARINDWQEIDAVLITGKDGSHHWAKSATASSYWGQGTPSIWEKPDTFRIAGGSARVAPQWAEHDSSFASPFQPDFVDKAPPVVVDAPQDPLPPVLKDPDHADAEPKPDSTPPADVKPPDTNDFKPEPLRPDTKPEPTPAPKPEPSPDPTPAVAPIAGPEPAPAAAPKDAPGSDSLPPIEPKAPAPEPKPEAPRDR